MRDREPCGILGIMSRSGEISILWVTICWSVPGRLGPVDDLRSTRDSESVMLFGFHRSAEVSKQKLGLMCYVTSKERRPAIELCRSGERRTEDAKLVLGFGAVNCSFKKSFVLYARLFDA